LSCDDGGGGQASENLPSEDGSQSFICFFFLFIISSPFSPFVDAKFKKAVKQGKAGWFVIEIGPSTEK
jgi:hypothetical protein